MNRVKREHDSDEELPELAIRSTKKVKAEPSPSYALPSSSNTASAQAVPSSSSASGSKSGRKKKVKAEEQEKRSARFRSHVPKAVQDRLDRVYTQRFFCVDRERTSPLSEDFKVLGSTGNVYTITISHEPSCDCPDFVRRGEVCKHMLFVYLRVLNVDMHAGYHYQKGLLTTELESIFAHAPRSPGEAMNERMAKIYRKAVGKDLGDAPEEDDMGKRRVPEGDDEMCAVCYENFKPGQTQGLTFCTTGCGSPVHTECFKQWSRQAQPVTCIMCRQVWPDQNGASGSNGKGATISEGYLNISAPAGTSSERDTSTYYNGPRRGQRRSNWDDPRNDRYNWHDGGRPYDSYWPGEHIPGPYDEEY